MKEAYKKALDEFLSRENVTGIARGLKFKDGQWKNEVCISIRVKQKLPRDQVKPEDLIPSRIMGFKTDVLEQELKPLSARVDPLVGGLSIGRENSTTSGTLGCVVFRGESPFCLTCFHVAVPPRVSSSNEWVLQPSLPDGGRLNRDRIGRLTDYSIANTGDFAILEIDTRLRQYSQSIYSTGDPIGSIRDPEIGDIVKKVGRTTGITQGRVSAIGVFGVNYSAWGMGVIYIYGFDMIPLSDPNEIIGAAGDSGSCVYVSSEKKALGILTAGSYGPTVIGCSLISRAFDIFGLSFKSSDVDIEIEIEAENEILQANILNISWLGEGESKEQSLDLIFARDYGAVALYVDPEYDSIISARLAGESFYKPVRPYSQIQSCILGNVKSGVALPIELKIQPNESSFGSQIIPVYITYGNKWVTGLNVPDIFWRGPDSEVQGWASDRDSALWLSWREDYS